MIRRPVVAGQFYPGTQAALREALMSLCAAPSAPEDAIGVVSPHAGYPYSGGVAAEVLSGIAPKETYIVMGPNHTGVGSPFAVSGADAWRTPLGDVPVATDLAEAIIKRSRYAHRDDLAHAREHSIEVQLPFLQHLSPSCRIVPIVVADAPLDMYRAVGEGVAAAIRQLKLTGQVTIVASSDMSHYESRPAAKKKDELAIEAILRLDEAALVERVGRYEISMCGYAPTAVMLVAARELGAKHARLVTYATSGDTTGDYASVMGYAGVVVTG